jgi:FlaA1/EpsC-like NDP-sugar epimerase
MRAAQVPIYLGDFTGPPSLTGEDSWPKDTQVQAYRSLSSSSVRDVPVGVLLDRDVEPVHGQEARLMVEDTTVLVMGAGGSIGSEIVRQVRHLGARKVICLDNNEYALYLLERELQGTALLVDETIVLGDIQHASAVDAIFATHKPQLVFPRGSPQAPSPPGESAGNCRAHQRIRHAHRCSSVYRTRIASVRFANVFGNCGSFVETFLWQIANGLP